MSTALIERIPLFSGLGASEIADIAMVASPFSMAKGEFLFEQGEPAEYLYLIEDGAIEIVLRLPGSREMVLANVGPDEAIGEAAFFDLGPRTAAARAVAPTRGLKISGRICDLIRASRRPGYALLLRRLVVRASAHLKHRNDLVDPTVHSSDLQSIGPLPRSVVEDSIAERRQDSATVPLDVLRTFPLLRSLGPPELELLRDSAHLVSLAKGELLFRQGAKAKSSYLVISGAIQIAYTAGDSGHTPQKLAVLTPGRPVGHFAMFDDSPRSASALAREATRLLEFERTQFDALTEQGSDMAFDLLYGMLDDIAESLRRSNRRLSRLLADSSRSSH